VLLANIVRARDHLPHAGLYLEHQDFKNQCESGAPFETYACHAAKSLTRKPQSLNGTHEFASYSLIRSVTVGGAAAGSVERTGGESARAGSRTGSEPVGSATEVGASLQQNRIGAFLRADDCYADQTIREPTAEGEYQKYIETLGQIEWRSISEVFHSS
jgi:hypothetical protein